MFQEVALDHSLYHSNVITNFFTILIGPPSTAGTADAH